MKNKYAVQFAGKTFTRTTARTYTHMVVAKQDPATHLEWAKHASDVQKEIDKINEAVEAGRYDVYHSQGWCSRLDLAQKLVGSLGMGWRDAQIVEVK